MATLDSRDEGYAERSARVASELIAGLYAVVWLVVAIGFVYLLYSRLG